ncbi:MAG: 3-dehydroquinate synthase [Alphaproteobacteria bacterium]|nr:3-dehydroquinate synthase [Alphaproteobacteria bacterium]
MNNIELSVELGKNSYPVFIGKNLLSNIGEKIKSFTDLNYAIIITDKNVEEIHLPIVKKSLEDNGINPRLHIIDGGENSKSLETYSKLIEDILEQGIERKTTLIALGGGVVGDLGGFVASSLLRGIKFIQIPTTLLSQVDSSIGGKTGINSDYGKNLIGAFYQPSMVISDIDVLKTLPSRELSAGLAEVIKYGLIKDRKFFDYLNTVIDDIQDDDFIEIIKTSCKIKADLVSKDEKEKGVRALLNLGHTFGHAIEKYCNYDGTILHGEAISIGMVLAYRVGVIKKTANDQDLEQVIQIFKLAKLPTKLSDLGINFDKNKLLEYMYKDKKVENGKLKLVLPNNIGDAYTTSDFNVNDIQFIWENA